MIHVWFDPWWDCLMEKKAAVTCGCDPVHRADFVVPIDVVLRISGWYGDGQKAAEEGRSLLRKHVFQMAMAGCPDAGDWLYGEIFDFPRRRTGDIRRSKPERRYHVRREDEERRQPPIIESGKAGPLCSACRQRVELCVCFWARG